MSPYDSVVAGKLKLKGKALDVKVCGIKRKKERDKRYHHLSQTSSGFRSLANQRCSIFPLNFTRSNLY
ncbi:FAM32A protein [Spatholobus suberectus]|nr:FAM32A protein [Spatholobus suberectus]